MMFRLGKEDIIQITASAFAAGMAHSEAVQRPKRDLITQAEARRRFGAKDLMRWKENGQIHPRRGGTSKNHSIWYSIAEIAKAQCQDTLQRAVYSPANLLCEK